MGLFPLPVSVHLLLLSGFNTIGAALWASSSPLFPSLVFPLFIAFYLMGSAPGILMHIEISINSVPLVCLWVPSSGRASPLLVKILVGNLLLVHPSIHELNHISFEGRRGRSSANPSWHWARGRTHSQQVASLSHVKGQPTFHPHILTKGNLEWPFDRTWSWSTQRHPTQGQRGHANTTQTDTQC